MTQKLYAVMCFDGANSTKLRHKFLEEHRNYVNENSSMIVSSGPLLDEDGITRCGQLFILDVLDLREATVFINADPFTSSGLFDKVIVRQFAPIFSDGVRQRTHSAQTE